MIEPNDDCRKKTAQVFAQHGLRHTRQRCAVYEALSATTSHPTADELYQTVARSDQSISLATVYNTLEAFCRHGLVHKLATNGVSARFDAATHNHVHLRDEETGQVADAPDHLGEKLLDELPRDVVRAIESQLGFRIHQVKIELVGEFVAGSEQESQSPEPVVGRIAVGT